MPPSPAPDRLLHCSPDRTVWARADAARAGFVVSKVFVTGSPSDAEREFALGTAAAGDGVVRLLEVGTDAASNRPCVLSRHEAGVDLDQLVAERGALPAAMACELLAGVATTLARLHGLRSARLPSGLCHGDIKPKNLLRTPHATLLLDFEHSQPIAAGGASTEPCPPGTAAFAAPEAMQQAAAHGSRDVFSLGATLRWLLDGGGARQLPQHPAVERLLADCLALAPAARPTAATVATRLRALATQLANDPAETVLADWSEARFAHSPPTAVDAADRRVHPWERKRRIARLLQSATTLPGDPAELLARASAIEHVLAHFGRHRPALDARRAIAATTGRMLAAAAQQLAAWSKAEAFAAGVAWLDALQALFAHVRQWPGGCPIPADGNHHAIGLLHREPAVFLQRLRQQLDAAAAELAEGSAHIDAAERRLALGAADAAIEQLAQRFGGASPTVARRRDELHRLTFYLDRIARAEANVERLLPLWDQVALQPLRAFVAATIAATNRQGRTEVGGTVGLRNLQLTLASLTEEMPHLDAAAPALEALTMALGHVTDHAWELLHDAQQRLRAVPVPVRPLQLAIGRLDTLRTLEALVDRPQRPRSQLLDGIESLRLAFEQARASRDRLTQSAENSLARGHWTTGLFDMERAVAGLQPSDDQDREQAERLQERLAEARRRKQEIEVAVRRNVELATRYASLQDDAAATFAARVQLLEERRDGLLFLAMHVPAERAELYRRDLRDVETQIALERAGLAEQQLDATTDITARLQLARATLSQLSLSMSATDPGLAQPARFLRLVEHWRTLAAQCQQALDARTHEQAMRLRQRRRVLAIAVVALLATTAAVVFAVRPWLLGQPAMAAGK